MQQQQQQQQQQQHAPAVGSRSSSPKPRSAVPNNMQLVGEAVSQAIKRRFSHPQEGDVVVTASGRRFRILREGCRDHEGGRGANVLSSAVSCGRALRAGMSRTTIETNHLLQNMHNKYRIALKQFLTTCLEEEFEWLVELREHLQRRCRIASPN